MKNSKEQELVDKVNETEFKKSLKEEKAVTGSAPPELKIVEQGVTDGQGNYVAYGADGKVPEEHKETVKGWKHKYRTLSNDTTVID